MPIKDRLRVFATLVRFSRFRLYREYNIIIITIIFLDAYE